MSNNGTSTCVLKVNFKGVWKRVKMVECFDDVMKLLHDVFKYEKTNDEKVNVFEIDMNNQKNVISNNEEFVKMKERNSNNKTIKLEIVIEKKEENVVQQQQQQQQQENKDDKKEQPKPKENEQHQQQQQQPQQPQQPSNPIYAQIEGLINKKMEEMQTSLQNMIITQSQIQQQQILQQQNQNMSNIPATFSILGEGDSESGAFGAALTNRQDIHQLIPEDISNINPDQCIKCKTAFISGVKYQCAICENISLCPNCISFHNEHPLIMFTLTQTSIYNSKNDLMMHYMSASSNIAKSEQSLNQPLMKCFKRLSYNEGKSEIKMSIFKTNKITNFAVAINNPVSFDITVKNENRFEINEDIYIYIKNSFGITKDNVKVGNNFKAYQEKRIKLSLQPFDKEYTYGIEIGIQGSKSHIIHEPIIIGINYVPEDKVELKNAELLMKEYNEMDNINSEDKITLYKYITTGIKANIDNINEILRKYGMMLPLNEYDD